MPPWRLTSEVKPASAIWSVANADRRPERQYTA